MRKVEKIFIGQPFIESGQKFFPIRASIYTTSPITGGVLASETIDFASDRKEARYLVKQYLDGDLIYDP